MLARLRSLLGIGVKSQYVRTYLARSNMETLFRQTAFFAVLFLIVLAFTFAPVPPWTDRTADVLTAYRIGFALIVVVNVALHFICRKLLDSPDLHPAGPYFALYSYMLVIVAIGAALTACDYAANQGFFAYVIALIVVFGLLYIPPAVTMGALVVATPVLVLALHAEGFYGFAIDATLCVYGFLVIVVSASNFHSQMRAGKANEQVRDMSMHDEMTSTKNRRALDEEASGLAGAPLFLVIGDIDEFKFYNDTYGHTAGDEILRQLAKSMQRAFGADNVYRFGGDEFVAVAHTDSREDFEAMVEAWRDDFGGTEFGEEGYSPTTSAGFVGAVPATGDDVLTMLRIADIRLYDAKEDGRNRAYGLVLDEQTPEAFLAGETSLSRRRMNHLDELTGLPSVSYFANHARTVIDAASEDARFDVVYFNIENLKIYNNRFGFAAGDELLAFVARTIEETFEHSLVARFGDDRFVMLTGHEGLAEGLGRVHGAVRSFNPESSTVIRAGVYPYERGMEITAACDRAKLACDHIKGHYNVYFYVYRAELLEEYNRQQLILDRFDHAIAHGHIQVHYQPIMRTVGPRICEFEALARWTDPEDGPIMADDFIPVLEEYRIIHRMDLEILEQVCRNYRTLVDEGASPVPTNVNLSRFDLELCDVVSEVIAIMGRYDVPPEMVNIEITESAFAENRELLRTVIGRFHEHGMQVWMDDFGSGYSSLNMLREFDFDAVKIDLRFLRNDTRESLERSRLMLPHIISMAKELGIQTLAEGVESESQFEFLKLIGCEKLQGYIFDKPGDLGRMRLMLAGDPSPVENPDMRAYFDAIGQVNLLKPTTIDYALSHDIELSSGLPAAVIEFLGDTVRYLLWNSSYLDYLVDIGMGTIENSEAQMNDLTRVQSQGFFRVAEQYRGSGEWINLTFYEEGDLCTAMARCISVDACTGACSFVYIAFNLSKYLDRTGSKLPPIQ